MVTDLSSVHFNCDHFEPLFCQLVATDLENAGLLVGKLKRKCLSLPLQEAHKQRLIGWYHEKNSNHKLAIKWSNRAMDGYRQAGNHQELHQCLRVLFASHAHLGHYKSAHNYAQLALADPNLSEYERVKMRTNLGSLAYRIQNYALAYEHFSTALAQLKAEPSDPLRATLLYNLGVLAISLNQFAEARDNLQEAEALFSELNQHYYHAHTLQSLGFLYTILGQYFHAENRLEQAQEVYRRIGDQTGSALCDIELLRLDTRLNRFERALERIPDLAEAFAEKERFSEMGHIYYQGILAAIAKQENGLAREFLEKAQIIFDKEKNLHFVALCTMIDGFLLCRRGQQELGHLRINQARLVFRDSHLHEQVLECFVYAWHLLGKLPDEHSFSEIREILKTPLSPSIRIQGLVLLHYYWFQKGQVKRAINCLFEAINLIEESRATITLGHLRESFFADKSEVYELLLERLLAWKDSSSSRQIFRVMELSRGRQMAEQLSGNGLMPDINRDEPLVMRWHNLDMRLTHLNSKWAHLEEHTSLEEKQQLLSLIGQTQAKIVALRKDMRREQRIGLFYPVEFSAEEIMAQLPVDTLLVIYFLGSKTLYRIELTHRRLKTYQHDLKGFHGQLNRLMNILANRITPQMRQLPELVDSLSALLYPSQTGMKRIGFVMHKQLQRFPLALLRKSGRYLIEGHLINQYPNLAVFHFTRTRPLSQYQKPVFFFSDSPEDPLASERELLQSQYPQAQTLTRLQSSKLAETLGQSDFIHFAGHCIVDREQPDQSYLMMGGERLMLHDFNKIVLKNSPLLNLAACQSGWMVHSAGNEPQGFIIGSFAAGAASLLASLWDIDDEGTAAWMNLFYRNLHLGLADAYREACLAFIRKGEDPYLWAGFCLVGRA